MGYLVIGLKVGQRFLIGEIEILVADSDRGRVDLAVNAPREIRIKRIPTHAEEAFGKKQNGDQNPDK